MVRDEQLDLLAPTKGAGRTFETRQLKPEETTDAITEHFRYSFYWGTGIYTQQSHGFFWPP